MKPSLLFFLLMFPALIRGQGAFWNEVPDSVFTRGLYLTHEDFVNNNPLLTYDEMRAVGDISGWYYKAGPDGMLTIHEPDTAYEIHPLELWGFADGRSIYVNRLALPPGLLEFRDAARMPWARLNIVGTICLIHFIPDMSRNVLRHPGSNMGISAGGGRPIEYIFNTRDGNFYKPTLGNLARILADDPVLFDEFRRSREDRTIKFHLFMKRYNERNPMPVLLADSKVRSGS